MPSLASIPCPGSDYVVKYGKSPKDYAVIRDVHSADEALSSFGVKFPALARRRNLKATKMSSTDPHVTVIHLTDKILYAPDSNRML